MRRARTATRWITAATLIVAAGTATAGQAAAQDTAACEDRPALITWDGDAGTTAWAEPTNWSGDALPGPGSHACIAVAGTTVSLDSGLVASLASLQVALGSGLVVSGNATLDLDGPEPLDPRHPGCSSGAPSRVAARAPSPAARCSTRAPSRATAGRSSRPVPSCQVGSGGGGTLAINGGHVLAIEAGATRLWGPGPHDITLDAPSRIENAGELDITNDRTLGGSGTLANTGTLRKLSHGTTTLRPAARQRRPAGRRRGRARCRRAATAASAATAPSRSRRAPGCASATAPRPSAPAAAIGGPGELEVTSSASLSRCPRRATYDIATTYLTGGTLTLEGDRTLATLGLYAGTLAGGGTRTITGSAVLDAGTLTGNGRTVIAPGAQAPGGQRRRRHPGHQRRPRAGHRGGRHAALGPGTPRHHSSTPRRASRTRASSTSPTTATLGGSGTLANTGTLRKLSHGTTTLRLLLDNDGQLAVDAGVSMPAGGDGGLGSDGARHGRGTLPAAPPRRHHDPRRQRRHRRPGRAGGHLERDPGGARDAPPTTSPRATSRAAPWTSRATAAWPPWASTRAPSRVAARAP